MLKIEHLTKVFYPGTVNEKMAINDLSLNVEEGEIVCVIGSNGSGKSTLFNLVSGSYPLTSGKIILNGNDVTNSPEYKRAFTIGRIFQDPTKGTAANMSIEDNMITASRKGMRGFTISLTDKKREEFRKLLQPIGLQDRLKDNVGLLSGGQRQALTLLMTVLSNPKVILLDEHTAALDPGNAATVMALTQKYISAYKLTAVMVTHNMQFAIEYGTRLIMMDEGQIILDVNGEDKKKLTVEKLVEIFKNIKNKEFASDRGLLAI
ncbi:MAG: ATP-binding cassette domain-containing protein [Sphaerochaetaceae bacterium]|jgi:putative tryptophan/tyrosine transport system ATP-binding protein|nr:ATP-binding cassette domain-containing protein [Sphaerochaetaceae bacterium]